MAGAVQWRARSAYDALHPGRELEGTGEVVGAAGQGWRREWMQRIRAGGGTGGARCVGEGEQLLTSGPTMPLQILETSDAIDPATLALSNAPRGGENPVSAISGDLASLGLGQARPK